MFSTLTYDASSLERATWSFTIAKRVHTLKDATVLDIWRAVCDGLGVDRYDTGSVQGFAYGQSMVVAAAANGAIIVARRVGHDVSLPTFGRMAGNAKTAPLVAMARERGMAKALTFSLPAGWTCPYAHECESRADRATGRIQDGTSTQFRCYAASMESRFPNVRASRWHNFEALKAAGLNKPGDMAALILAALAENGLRAGVHALVRIHVSGDFFNPAYTAAWVAVARALPRSTFYAYTKALPNVLRQRHDIPDNLRIIASYGGTHDALIGIYQMRSAVVVYSEQAAADAGLQIDHDDSLAAFGSDSFALLIHGTQPQGSHAAKAVAILNLQRIE